MVGPSRSGPKDSLEFRRFLLICVLSATFTSSALAQLQLSHIHGIVVDERKIPVAGAMVSLFDPLGGVVHTAQSDAMGSFHFPDVAPGSYSLQAESGGLQSLAIRIAVQSALPLEVEVQLKARLTEKLVVSGEAVAATVSTRVSIGGDTVRRSVGRLRSNGLQSAVAGTPGWSTEDNGLLHVRGVDDGILYVHDGLPIYDRLDTLFGILPDSSILGSVHVLTGYIPPEYGFKSGGVVEVRSESSLKDSWTGALEIGSGSFATREISASAAGPLTGKVGLLVNYAGEQSARFLDPVHPDNFHNSGHVQTGGAHLFWTPSEGHAIAVSAGHGRSSFQIPHGEHQEEAGQNQRQQVDQTFGSVSWQRFWSNRTVSQIAAYARSIHSELKGSEKDTPLFVRSDRTQRRVGAIASLTHLLGKHTFKSGAEFSRLSLREFFTFAVTDREEGRAADLSQKALEFDRSNPFVFRDRIGRAQWSIYFQDSYQLRKNLAFDLGVRLDRTNLLHPETQWSPRVGASYRWDRSKTTLRASFNRFFQPPQAENLLLSSSAQARALSPFVDEGSEGGAILRAERQSAFEVGLEQWWRDLARLDIAYWHKRVRNYADPNVFFGTTLIFPNSVNKGRASGLDLRLEIPRRRGFSGYLSYTNSRVIQYGPINGGLFLEDEFLEIGPGTPFIPDHDQRNAGEAGISYEHGRSGSWLTLRGRHESGTPLQLDIEELEELRTRPGAHLVNFERGRVRPRTLWHVSLGKRLVRKDRTELSASAEIVNLTNRAYAFNFENPFSGTHFGSPRTFSLKLRLRFF